MEIKTADQIEQLIDNYKSTLNLTKRKEFLIKWAQALESYDTPAEFVMPTRFEDGTYNDGKIRIEYRRIIADNNAARTELMKKQKPYLNQLKENEYHNKLSLDNCFLCQNIAQALDANQFDSVKDNKVFDHIIDYYVLPNRYPSSWGHSLWIPMDHDDMTSRVIPIGEKKDIYIPENGKTRGKLLDRGELSSLFKLCDTYKFVAQRNHVLDAMSIPGHDHFHMHFEEQPNYSYAENLIKFERSNQFDGSAVYRAANTPFDTLVLSRNKLQDFFGGAEYLLQNMERDNQVFTLAYYKGNLLVSPRINISENKRIGVGAGIHLHSFDKNPNADIATNVLNHVPLKGEYDWNKYLD